MTAPRPFVVVLIVVIVVLVGIYVLGLGKGLQGTRAPRMQDLKRRFGDARALRLEELVRSGACSQVAPGRLRIPAWGTCNLVANKARPWQRRAVVISSKVPLEVTVKPAAEPKVEVTGTTKPTEDQTKSPRFSVPSAGATIAIKCNGPPECLLDVIPP